MIPLVIIAESKEKVSKIIEASSGRKIVIINNCPEDYSLSLYLKQMERCGFSIIVPSEKVDFEKASAVARDYLKQDCEVIFDSKEINLEELKAPPSPAQTVIKTFPYPFTDEQRNIKGIKLHLGCSNIYLTDFINIDLDSSIADESFDASKLDKYKDNSVSLILASHIIEHFDWRQHERILKEWYRVLMPNCWLIIEAPDVEESFKQFLDEKDDNRRLRENFPQIFGRPDFSTGNIHLSGVWPSYLNKLLSDIGFRQKVMMPPVRNIIERRCLRIDALK
jgi:SAM-dependent methyltransferase